MTQTTAATTETEPPTADPVAPYAHLVQRLLPRAVDLAIFGPQGQLLWSPPGQDCGAFRAIAGDVLAAPPGDPYAIDGREAPGEGDPCYAFRICGASGWPAAVVVVATPGSEPTPFRLALGLVRPALECLCRELELRDSVGTLHQDLARRDRDLQLLLDGTAPSGREAAADLYSRLLQAATEHLEAFAGALVVPSQGLAIVRRDAGDTGADATAIVSQAHRHLWQWARSQQRPLLVNASAGASALPACHIVCVPVRQSPNRVIGFAAWFRAGSGAPFEPRHAQLAELLARRVGTDLQGRYDPATGLATRAAFEAEVGARLRDTAPAQRSSVIYLDIDQMHVINENFGMPAGDAVIGRVADLLRSRAPRNGIKGRLAGDRFALFLSGCDLATAAETAEALRRAASELSHAIDGATLRVSLSAGVAPVHRATPSPLGQALTAAEIACRAAKDRGRDRVERFEDADPSVIRRYDDAHLVTGLRDAIDKNQFRLYAQLIQPLARRSAAPRYEILLRRLDTAGVLQSPDRFLSAAERYQMMPAIDQWVMSNAFAALGAHRDLLLASASAFALNLSAQSLGNEGLIIAIEKACAAARVPAERICFELTETAAVANIERTRQIMDELCRQGFRFALDDFGTGQSSLLYLKSLPVAMLKIDGAFVRDAATNARSADMVRAIAQLASTLGMATVAEWVETTELLELMTQLGVDYGQGFAIGKPIPLEQALKEAAQASELNLSLEDTLARHRNALRNGIGSAQPQGRGPAVARREITRAAARTRN